MKCVKNIFSNFGRCTFLATIITLFFSLMLQKTLRATPINNVYDPVAIHTPAGTDKFYTNLPKNEFNFTLAPFYIHSATAKNGLRKKVPGGERLGQWNMFGVFYDLSTMGSGYAKKADLETIQATIKYDKLSSGQFAPEGVGDNFVDDTNESHPILYPDSSRPHFVVNNTSSTTTPTTLIGSFTSLPVDYEKLGLRSQMSFDFKFGVGIVVKGGLADCKATPKFQFSKEFMDKVLSPSETNDPSVEKIYNNLLCSDARDNVASALGVDFGEYRKTGFEDTHIEAYWNLPFDFKDEAGDVTATIIPRISLGAWIPTSPHDNVDKIFNAPLGNNGFWAFTAEGALSFDFPETIQMSFGGGVVVAERKTVTQRMPNSIYQSGFYPWKTRISKEPGVTWYVNASFKADNFTDGLSFYFDYIFTEHLKDSITILESNKSKKDYFLTALDKVVKESAWRSQQWQSGLNYQVTDMLAFGFAVQSHITGVRVFRPTNVLGTMTLTF